MKRFIYSVLVCGFLFSFTALAQEDSDDTAAGQEQEATVEEAAEVAVNRACRRAFCRFRNMQGQ